MKIKMIKEKNVDIAVISSDELLLTDVQSSLDLMASVGYDTNCTRIVINKSAVCEDFFQLRTKLAGEILQKFVNYHVKLAIVGDFSQYESKALRDFIYESNKGKHIFFVSDEKQAVEKLCSA
jgi:hypothetical protein